jgi:hypothetical protein
LNIGSRPNLSNFCNPAPSHIINTSDMHASRPNTLLLALILLCFAWRADGHAIVLSATPGVNEIVNGPDVAVKLRFNARIDAQRSKLILVGPNGEQSPLSVNQPASADTLVSEAKGLKGGPYVLRWQVLASDGHITRGEVLFRVR